MSASSARCAVAPILSTEPACGGAQHAAMNTARQYTRCAAPECRSEARDGHVCTYHYGTIYASSTYDAGLFLVVATCPERPNVIQMFQVRAFTATQAKDAARGELAKEKRDHWSITAERRR